MNPRLDRQRPPSRCAVRRGAAVSLILAAAIAWPAAAASSTMRPPARLVAADAGRVVFRVDLRPHTLTPSPALKGTVRLAIPGFDNEGTPGQPPVLSRQFLVAVPPSGACTVSWRVLGTRDLGTVRLEPVPFEERVDDEDMGPTPTPHVKLDPAIYNAYVNPPLVEARDTGWIRRQRVLPVVVHPLVYDPASGRASLASSIEITVTLTGASRGTGAAAAPAAPESPMWDGLFARLVVNPGQIAQWRAPRRFQWSAQPAPPRMLQQGGLVKLEVRTTGIHAVTASQAVAKGFPAGQAIGSLHLFQRTYSDATLVPGVRDIAFTVEEKPGGVAGVFDGDDILVFYGRRLRDDPAQGDTIEKFSDHNVYWLGSDGGPAMAERALTPGVATADTATAVFPVNDHFEIDNDFLEESPVGTTDFYYFNDWHSAGPVNFPFQIGAVQPGTEVVLSVGLQGAFYRSLRALTLSLVNAKGTSVLASTYILNNKSRQTFQATVPAASVVDGANIFRLARPDSSRSTVEVAMNWVETSYQSRYRARGNALRFNTGALSGPATITVTGLTTETGLWLFDVTDPDAPVRCTLPAGGFSAGEGGGFAFSFLDTLAARKKYILVPESGMTALADADVVADTPSTIIGGPGESGVDVLVVAYKDFIPGMQQWVTYRRAQGYRVLMVDVEDVYDEFNNGIPSVVAVDRFVRHFYELGGASVLVLVGDSSEDNKHIYNDPTLGSGPNFVPTHSFPDNVPSLRIDEVITSDKRYVKLPGPGGGVDIFPDMIVGRIPVGSETELQRVLQKTFQFEAPTASDFWRKRMLMVADDAYSEGYATFGGFTLDYTSTEEYFERGQDQAATIIENSLPAGYNVERFFQTDYTHAIHQTSSVPRTTAITYVRTYVTPLLMDELAKGATLVTIQSHMNRALVCHEKLLATESSNIIGVPNLPGQDHLRMDNRGRPFVLFALGCHFSDYALNRELGRFTNKPNGDCFAEQLLFSNNRGAVDTYGSSAFEYLDETNDLMNRAMRVWFYDAPYDTMINQTRAQWVFGELMFLTESTEVTLGAPPRRYAIDHYHILGDPLLHIDAGPPAFNVTVDGKPFETGGIVQSGGEGDTLRVRAVVTDENAIQAFKLTIGGVDETSNMQVTQLTDKQLPNGRQYELSFSHKLRPSSYDIVIQAFQAPDTTAGQYHIAAQFVLQVRSTVSLTVNGRAITSGDHVPARGDYRVDLKLPVVVPRDSVGVTIDGNVVSDLSLSHPSVEDSTAWIALFSRQLDDGKHVLVVSAGAATKFTFDLVVSSDVGLRDVITWPNPFVDTTNFVYTNDVEISDGTITIYTTSGKRVRRLYLPPGARQPGENAVLWDGRDAAGGEIANGIYLYVIEITQRGKTSLVRGKLSHIH